METGSQLPSLIGCHLDHHRVEAALGQGGMGAVYRARDLQLDRPVALKILAGNEADESGSQASVAHARFTREARVLAALNHPHVAQIYWLGSYAGRPYLTMELLPGPTLAELIGEARENGRELGLDRVLGLLAEAASGLGAAFSQRIVHRDIKPSNLMLDAAGRLKVVDFGLARELGGDTTITRANLALGTPRYMAPEVALGQPADHRSDIYSLGATFYHLLALESPFRGDSALSLMLHQVNTPAPSLRTQAPGVPGDVAALIDQMLAKDPAARPATYAQLEKTVSRLRERLGEPASTLLDLPPAQHQLASDQHPPREGASPRRSAAASPSPPAGAPPSAVTLTPATRQAPEIPEPAKPAELVAPATRHRPAAATPPAASRPPAAGAAARSSGLSWPGLALLVLLLTVAGVGLWAAFAPRAGVAPPARSADATAPATGRPTTGGDSPAEPAPESRDESRPLTPVRDALRERLGPPPGAPPTGAPATLLAAAARLQVATTLQRVGVAIQTFAADEGHPPERLAELHARGLVVAPDLVDAWGTSLLYEVDGNTCRLASAGPDRAAGTADDLHLAVPVS